MKKFHLENGRTLLETLAVLVLIGLLSISGMLGYGFLHKYLKRQETIKQIETLAMNYRATPVKPDKDGYVSIQSIYPSANRASVTEMRLADSGTASLQLLDETTTSFAIVVNNIDSDTCEEYLKKGSYDAVRDPTVNKTSNNDTDTNPSIVGKTTLNSAEKEELERLIENICGEKNSSPTYWFGNCPQKGWSYWHTDKQCHRCAYGVTEDRYGHCCSSDKEKKTYEDCGVCNCPGDAPVCNPNEKKCVKCYNKEDGTCVGCTPEKPVCGPEGEPEECIPYTTEGCVGKDGKALSGNRKWCSKYHVCEECLENYELGKTDGYRCPTDKRVCNKEGGLETWKCDDCASPKIFVGTECRCPGAPTGEESGNACSDDCPCIPGLVCAGKDETTGIGTCQCAGTGKKGESCGLNCPCQDGLFCDNNVCTCRTTGVDCTSDNQCCSDACMAPEDSSKHCAVCKQTIGQTCSTATQTWPDVESDQCCYENSDTSCIDVEGKDKRCCHAETATDGTNAGAASCCPSKWPVFKSAIDQCCPNEGAEGDTCDAETGAACCADGNCSNGHCCPTGKTYMLDDNKQNGLCCAEDEHNSYGLCCKKNEHNSDGICCPAGKDNVNGHCCDNPDASENTGKTGLLPYWSDTKQACVECLTDPNCDKKTGTDEEKYRQVCYTGNKGDNKCYDCSTEDARYVRRDIDGFPASNGKCACPKGTAPYCESINSTMICQDGGKTICRSGCFAHTDCQKNEYCDCVEVGTKKEYKCGVKDKKVGGSCLPCPEGTHRTANGTACIPCADCEVYDEEQEKCVSACKENEICLQYKESNTCNKGLCVEVVPKEGLIRKRGTLTHNDLYFYLPPPEQKYRMTHDSAARFCSHYGMHLPTVQEACMKDQSYDTGHDCPNIVDNQTTDDGHSLKDWSVESRGSFWLANLVGQNQALRVTYSCGNNHPIDVCENFYPICVENGVREIGVCQELGETCEKRNDCCDSNYCVESGTGENKTKTCCSNVGQNWYTCSDSKCCISGNCSNGRCCQQGWTWNGLFCVPPQDE